MLFSSLIPTLGLLVATSAMPVLPKKPVDSKRHASGSQAALPAPVRVTSVEGITEYALGNGLHVLLFPDASKPEMTVNITYLVGSRNESYGETGMAHLLEHLMFKGTDRHPDVPKVLNALGARFNGTTDFDRTNYFVMFPASEANLTTALELEADRMVNSHIWKNDLWNEQEKHGEMTVVRNEMESGENNPQAVTTERLASVAFDWHNYGKSPIGARSDVENVNIEHLKNFYQRYYQPDNAWLLVAGQIDEAKTLAQINQLFGSIPRPSRTLEKTWTVEPVQDGPRSVTIERVGGAPFLAIGYHVPQAASVEADAIALVAELLDNAPSGRLYKALVDSKLAARVGDQTSTTLDPSFLEFLIELPAGADVAKAQAAALGVIEGLKDKPITAEELERVRAEQMKNYDLLAQHTDIFAINLSESIGAGDWRLFFLSRDRIEKMTLAQVQAAAENYLKESNRSVGVYIPTDKPSRAQPPAPVDIAGLVSDYKGRAAVKQGEQFDPTPQNIEARLTRFGDKDGLQGVLLAKKNKGGAVNLNLVFHYGSEESLMNVGAVPTLVSQMLLRGSQSHTRSELKDAFDRLKAQVSINGAADQLRVSLTTDGEHLQAALALLAEVLEHPSFPPGEFDTLRAEQLTELQEAKEQPQTLAMTAVSLAVTPYPKGHPLAPRDIDTQIAELKSAQLDELKAFHSVFYGAQRAEAAAVGDFDPKLLQAQLQQLFGSWRSSQPFVRIPARQALLKPLDQKLETPDKANAFFIAESSFALKEGDADYPAYLIANRILGGGALKSRLADRIRQKEGISYGVGSFFRAPALDPAATWMAYAIYAPENVGRLDAAFREELKKAVDSGVTADELAYSKNTWLQGVQVSRTQDGELVSKLVGNAFLNRTMQFDADLESREAGLTVEQVNAACKTLFDASRLTIVKAGDFNKAAPTTGTK